jgi:hypothetical protein
MVSLVVERTLPCLSGVHKAQMIVWSKGAFGQYIGTDKGVP